MPSAQRPLMVPGVPESLPHLMLPPSESRPLRGRKKTPSCSSFWLIKWIFLWVFWWNSLFLASKSSARGSDLLRDQLRVTTNPGEAGTSLGVGLEGSHPQGRQGRRGLRGPDSGPELLPNHSGSTCLGPDQCLNLPRLPPFPLSAFSP